MKKLTGEWVAKAEGDLGAARQLARGRPPHHDQVCFCCQQAIEKYLKALLQEWGLPIARTHNITALLDELIPHDRTLRAFRRGTKTLIRYAVEYRYPGLNTTARQARLALAKAELFRHEVRNRLGLRTRRRK